MSDVDKAVVVGIIREHQALTTEELREMADERGAFSEVFVSKAKVRAQTDEIRRIMETVNRDDGQPYAYNVVDHDGKQKYIDPQSSLFDRGPYYKKQVRDGYVRRAEDNLRKARDCEHRWSLPQLSFDFEYLRHEGNEDAA